MISALLNAILQFTLHASDPQWSCKVAHREPGIPATMLLYCTTTSDGVEVVSVGKYVPDAAPKDAR